MHLPQPLYNALPALYVVSGLATLVAERGNLVGIASAAVLIAAGAIIATWRFQHRARLDAEATARMGFRQRRAKRSGGEDFQVG